MLVRITEYCDMGCTHCRVDANPKGQHMTLETYNHVLLYLKRLGLPSIMISGGEPTNHPDITEIINRAKKANMFVLLLSNGTFLEKEELKEKILSMKIGIQIVNDPRYYPRRVPIIEYPDLIYENKVRIMSPCKRVSINNIPVTSKYPECFNLRSVCRNGSGHSLGNVLKDLVLVMGRACTPSVNIDGSISAGEGNDCKKVGYITDSLDTLFNRLCSMRCNHCKRVYNLTDTQKKAIGESR